MAINTSDIDRFEEIMQEMKDLADEAFQIAKQGHEGERAKAYWYAHLLGAIDKENSGYMGGSMIDMASTLETLKEDPEPQDFDDDLDDMDPLDRDLDEIKRMQNLAGL